MNVAFLLGADKVSTLFLRNSIEEKPDSSVSAMDKLYDKIPRLSRYIIQEMMRQYG